MMPQITRSLALAVAAIGLCSLNAHAQTNVPSTFKHISIDGSFDDWTGVPLAYTAPVGATNAIQYENVYIANDQTNLYIRFTLYAPRPDAFANSYDNIFIDADDNSGTGYPVAGIGSEMLIQWGGGYQEKNGGFNEGNINGLGWNIAGSADGTDFELSISLGATYAGDGTPVFNANTIALLLEGDNTSYANTAFAPPAGGFVYTFATPPVTITTNTPLIALTNSWEVNAAGTDLGTNWLGQDYDDTAAGWSSGEGLFGYTPSPVSYPPILTPLTSGPNTYYFRTHFQWTNDTANLAFVVTNYLSDGAVYYLNGTQVRSVRMPSGAISYATAATGTNAPVGAAHVFGINGGVLQSGDNILEVETHQAPGSGADMVFGLSLTAETQYTVAIVNSNLPASQAVFAGQPVTFSSDIIGSGPLSYQWYFDGTNAIAGANGPAYTIPLVLTNDAGAYTLQVSNSFSGVTTMSALLTVSNLPVNITAEPVNAVAMAGQPAALGVTVTGTPVIQYQWFLNGNPISGATNSTYEIAAAAAADAGAYQVAMSNPAGTTNSSVANLTVLPNTIPPNITAIQASAGQIILTFSEPLDPVTAAVTGNYAVNNGVTVSAAALNPNNASQVILTTGTAVNLGTAYAVTVTGVNDLYGNTAHVSGQFARDITIDGSFDDWTGVAPVYVSDGPSGNTDAADFAAIYMYDDANYYYFYIQLWTDIDSASGQFPSYVNMFFNTDNNANTGYTAIGSDLLIQSGFGYAEKAGNFNDGTGITGLGFLSLPSAPGTNFEFEISKAATFTDTGAPVFSTNVLSYIFQGMTPGFVVENSAPEGGEITYTDVPAVSVAPLPLGRLAIFSLKGSQGVIVWNPPGTLQVSSSLTGGSWTNLPSATSPYIIPITGTNQFFRLMQ